jgi:subtilisin-like proprotein convertase family protein
MDTRSSAIRMVAALFLVMGFPSTGFSDPTHIYTGDFNLPIPSPDEPESKYGRGWMTDAIIEVPDHLVISDLDIGVTLAHESLFDLQILLQSPKGTNVSLNPAGNLAFIVRGEDGRLHAYGGSVEWFFDDEAEVLIEQATIPFVGAFKPVENLSSFDEQDAYGLWRLRIYDAFYADTGTFNRFELMITAPEPATAVLLTFGIGLVSLFKPRRGH